MLKSPCQELVLNEVKEGFRGLFREKIQNTKGETEWGSIGVSRMWERFRLCKNINISRGIVEYWNFEIVLISSPLFLHSNLPFFHFLNIP